MALHGYATLYKRNLIQAKCFGGVNFSEPGTYYFGIHFATYLDGPVIAGANVISLLTAPAVGANLIIAPSYLGQTDLNPEQHVVLGVSGVGPYTVTLADVLGFNHLGATAVAFDPGVDGLNVIEHAGDNYTRVSHVNIPGNYIGPSGGVSSSNLQLTWGTPTASWGLATHILGYDALTVGVLWDVFVLQSFVILDTSTADPTIAIGNLIARTPLPTD